MTKQCDNTSVGVVIRDAEGRFALLKRAKFPVGIAPAAGHIDDHGSPEQAALDEVREELGIVLTLDELKKPALTRVVSTMSVVDAAAIIMCGRSMKRACQPVRQSHPTRKKPKARIGIRQNNYNHWSIARMRIKMEMFPKLIGKQNQGSKKYG
jgi:NUDIX domain